MYAVIRKYSFDPAHTDAIDRKVREEFMPLLKKAAGFQDYYWLDSGHGEGVSLSVFDDRNGAEQSVHFAADWVKEHLAHLLGTPEVIQGEVKAHT